MLKIKFLSLTHPVQLHNVDDIFYLVNGCIILHNMMVEARLEKDEEESANDYDRLDRDEITEECIDEHSESDDDAAENNLDLYHDCFEIAQRRWESLYDFEGAKELQKYAKRHLYRIMSGDPTMSKADLMPDDYNPLNV